VKHLARLAVAGACALTAPGVAVASTIVVDLAGPIRSIQAGIDLALPGDVVSVHPGYYYERLTLSEGVAVTASTSGTVILEAEGDGSAITALGVGATTTVTGLVVRHGSAEQGGGLYAVAANPVFTNCRFTENVGILGGGACLRDGSRASFIGCTFDANSATVGGGLYLDFATVSISSCDLHDNVASDGAAIAANNAAEAAVGYCVMWNNRASSGAILACNLASPRFTNCTVAFNSATQGIFALRGSGSRLERCIVAFNTSAAIACSGFSSPWIGCNVLWANADQIICSGDQGTNIIANPMFCAPLQGDFSVAANSPALSAACGNLIGALASGCPAQGIDTAVVPLSWSGVKHLYQH
jgi:hypothetical protein